MCSLRSRDLARRDHVHLRKVCAHYPLHCTRETLLVRRRQIGIHAEHDRWPTQRSLVRDLRNRVSRALAPLWPHRTGTPSLPRLPIIDECLAVLGPRKERCVHLCARCASTENPYPSQHARVLHARPRSPAHDFPRSRERVPRYALQAARVGGRALTATKAAARWCQLPAWSRAAPRPTPARGAHPARNQTADSQATHARVRVGAPSPRTPRRSRSSANQED